MRETGSASTVRELDVRPILAAGRGPIGAILDAVKELPRGAALRIVAPFEPLPLYARLGEDGFDHVTTLRDDGAYAVTFTPRAAARPAPELLDLRGLEPPEPMLRVLETIEALPAAGTIVALTRFRPVHLLEILEHRGFVADSTPLPDGSHETIIRRRGAE